MSIFNIAHDDAPVEPTEAPAEGPAPAGGEETTTPEAPTAAS